MVVFFRRIRDLREDNDLKQSDVAAYLYVSRRTYSDYETGRTEPSYATLVRLALYYGTTTDYLLGISNERYPRINKPL